MEMLQEACSQYDAKREFSYSVSSLICFDKKENRLDSTLHTVIQFSHMIRLQQFSRRCCISSFFSLWLSFSKDFADNNVAQVQHASSFMIARRDGTGRVLFYRRR